jgi:PPP family 3-phenylpropionic acid transporter
LPAKSKDPFPFSIFFLFVIYYMAQPFYLTYIATYQRLHIEMSKTQIGLIGAGIALLMVFIKPVLGAITDKAENKNRVVFWLLLVSSLTILFFYAEGLFPRHSFQLFAFIAFCMLLHQVFFGTSATLFESNGVELLNERKGKWNSGHIRLGGTLGFMISTLISSYVIGEEGRFQFMFITMSVLCMVNALWVLKLPRVAGKAMKKERVPYSEILKNRPFLVLLLLQFTNSIGFVFFRFFNIYLIEPPADGGLGMGVNIVGILAFCNAALEIPIFWYAGKIRDKIGMKWFMFIAVMINATKYFLFSFVVSPGAILLITTITGFSFVGIHFCTVNFLNDHMPVKMRSTAQTLNGLVAQVLGAIVIGSMGGWLADTYTVPKMMQIGSGIIACGGILFFILFGKAMKYHNSHYGLNMTRLETDEPPAEQAV